MTTMMQEWIWREFRLRLPKDWEMLRFSREPDTGACLFADRQQFRLEFSWTTVRGAPDYPRLVGDYVAKLTADHGLRQPKAIEWAAWHGFEGELDSGWTSRFGRHFALTGRLLELVFFWPGKPEPALWHEILGSVLPAAPGDRQRWRAFGLDLRATGGLRLDTCRVLPGLAQFTFADARQAERIENFERLGLVELWLRGSVRDWLAGKQPAGLSGVATRTETVGQHQIEQVSGRLPALKFPRLGRNGCRYSAAAWICPADGRLYSVSAIGPGRDGEPARLAGERLACCDQLKCG